MSNINKTHYRKVLKSDHLGIADLEDFQEEGSSLIYNIKFVNQEHGARVAGKKIDANIAYFNEPIKPLVLNATNAATMRLLTGSPFIEDWQNIPVQLYIDNNVKMKGEIVGGVRISPIAPKVQQVITPENAKAWANVVNAYKRDGNFDKVLARAVVSPEHQQQIINEYSS